MDLDMPTPVPDDDRDCSGSQEEIPVVSLVMSAMMTPQLMRVRLAFRNAHPREYSRVPALQERIRRISACGESSNVA